MADDILKQWKLYREALERIADTRNTHFAGDAQVVACEALAEAARMMPELETARQESTQ